MDVFPSGHDQGRGIITVTGDVDLGTAEQLLVRLTALIGTARREIGLDLSGVTFIDCAGLTALLTIRKAVQAQDGWLDLVAVSRCVGRLIKIIGLRDVLAMPPPPRRPSDHPEASLVRSGQQATSSAR